MNDHLSAPLEPGATHLEHLEQVTGRPSAPLDPPEDAAGGMHDDPTRHSSPIAPTPEQLARLLEPER